MKNVRTCSSQTLPLGRRQGDQGHVQLRLDSRGLDDRLLAVEADHFAEIWYSAV